MITSDELRGATLLAAFENLKYGLHLEICILKGTELKLFWIYGNLVPQIYYPTMHSPTSNLGMASSSNQIYKELPITVMCTTNTTF